MEFCCVHGLDNTRANEDPNLVVPLDAMRHLEREGAYGKLYDTFYVTVGNGTTIANAERLAAKIGRSCWRWASRWSFTST